ncbi:MAG: DUF1015 domain-containing protein [Dehalococcoidales bacterium]|nr:MAG: DUF1015 domain-containing protein [Dehalococcoidales bacterium]
MAEIHPFRGGHYNQSLVSDLSKVICPPYDVISPQLQQELYNRSEHNFVRLEFGRELPQDTVGDNKYTRAATLLEQWLNRGILQVDEKPTIYLHDHYFRFQERRHRRRGIIACVRLEEWEAMVVRPHEGTLPGPRRDRLDLLWALQANTSPILAMFEDREQQIVPMLERETAKQPTIRASGLDSERHDVWAITDDNIIRQLANSLANQPFYIADGHHRYTSALTYRRERRSYSPPAQSDNEPYDFAMMTLVDLADPGLVILAPHRLVRGISRPLLDGLMSKLAAFFEIDRLSLTKPGVWHQLDELLVKTDEVWLACFGPEKDNILVLHMRDTADISVMMPSFHTELFQRLDVSIVDHIILEKLLEIDAAGDETKIHYSHDRQNAVNRVLDQEYQLAFFLRPVKPQLVRAIADVGETMPHKSTYFYPKTPVGLVFYPLA